MEPAQGMSMQSRLGAERPKRRPLVTLTPLIDVVFILLLFFMLASNLMDWRALQVATPAAGSSAPAPDGALRIELLADGGLRFDGQTMTITALEQRVAARLAEHPEQTLLIEPHGGVRLQAAIDVLERLAGIGARNVTLLQGREP